MTNAYCSHRVQGFFFSSLQKSLFRCCWWSPYHATDIAAECCGGAVGAQARLMSHALRKITANASKCNCTVLFLNQLRYKVCAPPKVCSGKTLASTQTYFAKICVRPLQRGMKSEAGLLVCLLPVQCPLGWRRGL